MSSPDSDPDAVLAPAEWTDLLPALPPAARARLGSRSDLIPFLTEQLERLGVSRLGLPSTASASLIKSDELVKYNTELSKFVLLAKFVLPSTSVTRPALIDGM